ncbi:hypothetical protein J2T20_005248, partial [Paenibacillus wynnii]|nr:hypothetical protein [Paenibacillus wynnii]
SYAGAWPLPRPDFHRLEVACLAGHAAFEASFPSENFRATAIAFPQSFRSLRCLSGKSFYNSSKNHKKKPGFRRFILRGMEKVTLEVGWHALAHNLLK